MLQAAGFLARSAYKLLEIQQRHKIITPGGHFVGVDSNLNSRMRLLRFLPEDFFERIAKTLQPLIAFSIPQDRIVWIWAARQAPGYRSHARRWGQRTRMAV